MDAIQGIDDLIIHLHKLDKLGYVSENIIYIL